MLPLGQSVCPVRIMCMVSIPAMVIHAPENDLKTRFGW